MEMVTKENGLKHLYLLHVYTAINTYFIHTIYVQYVCIKFNTSRLRGNQ